jgi:methyl-accepting chemotaxis protein
MHNNGGIDNAASLRQVDAVAHSLRQTAERAQQIEQAASRLAGTGTEHASGVDQARAAVESILTSIEQTATATEQLTRSQVGVASGTRDLMGTLETNATALQEIAA